VRRATSARRALRAAVRQSGRRGRRQRSGRGYFPWFLVCVVSSASDHVIQTRYALWVRTDLSRDDCVVRQEKQNEKEMVDARSRNPTPLAARQIYFARDYRGSFAVDAVALALAGQFNFRH